MSAEVLTTPRLVPLLALLAVGSLPAQITYVDASTSTNTTLANGAPYTPASANAADDQWTLRTGLGNAGTILSTHDTGGDEDGPMLRTRITGLRPNADYLVYSYHWSDGSLWRCRSMVSATQPSPPIPGYNTVHFDGSSHRPMQPLVYGSPEGYQQVSIDLTHDAAGYEDGGHFQNRVLIREANRWMFAVILGRHTASPTGTLDVYIDDLEGNQPSSNRTWYDGVGYELAPAAFGSGCGAIVPEIGFSGSPIRHMPSAVTLSGGLPTAPAALVIGGSRTDWNGTPLPFDLGSLGIAGCWLNVGPLASLAYGTDAAGAAQHPMLFLALPANPTTLFWQWAQIDGQGRLSMSAGLETALHR